MKKKLIIWDWNGTLLNDVDACVDSMNQMLRNRNMEVLTQEKYKQIFTFPVQKYYEQLGFNFNKESFEKLSVEYIDLYKVQSLSSPLQDGAVEVLKLFYDENYSQIIVSASEISALIKQVEQHHIFNYFDSIIGLNNIFAKSKLQNALDYMNESHFELDNVTLIGDTFHDYEVAKEIGCKCILINNGHQYVNKLGTNGSLEIIDSLEKLADLVDKI